MRPPPSLQTRYLPTSDENTQMISTETVAGYLQRLASNDPTPGGGAVAALHAAQGAALASMVAGFTSGPKYAEVAAEAEDIGHRATKLIDGALHAAQEDERLFGRLAAAYRMPRSDQEQKQARSHAIQQATRSASEPLSAVVHAAADLVRLADRLLSIGNPSVISDVAAAAASARAALAIAVVTLEMNINALSDEQEREPLVLCVQRAEVAMQQADQIFTQVRSGVNV